MKPVHRISFLLLIGASGVMAAPAGGTTSASPARLAAPVPPTRPVPVIPPSVPVPPRAPAVPSNPTLSQVCFFEEPQFKGGSICYEANRASPAVNGTSGMPVRSVSVPSGLGVTFYPGTGYTGVAITLLENAADVLELGVQEPVRSLHTFGSLKK